MNQFPASSENHNPARHVTCWPGTIHCSSNRECKKRKVERPDAQDASDVERPDVQRPDKVFLAQQQFRNQIRAQHEEQADAERTCGADSGNHMGQE